MKEIIKMTESEYIKAQLDYIKLFISATLVTIFLIGVYNLQTGGVDVINMALGVIIFLFVLAIETWMYVQTAKKLRE